MNIKTILSETTEPLYKYQNEHIHFEQWDIVMVDFGENIGNEKSGIRPAVVISKEVLNRASGNVIVAPLTKAANKFDEDGRLKLYGSQVYVSKKYYKTMSNDSIIQMEDMRSISRNRLMSRVTNLSAQTIDNCKKALSIVIG